MGRPLGMKKINGVWYMADGSVAPSSRDKITDDVVTPTPIIKVNTPQNGSQDTSERYTGYVMYSRQDIAFVEKKTSLVYRGDISDDHGLRVPVFFSADRSEDWCASHLTKMRKGI